MGGGAAFLLVAGVVVGACFAVAAVLDAQARRRGSALASGAAMRAAMREARRDVRARRGLLHLGRAPQSGGRSREWWEDGVR